MLSIYESKSAIEQFYGVLPKWIKYLKPFGEMMKMKMKMKKTRRMKTLFRLFHRIGSVEKSEVILVNGTNIPWNMLKCSC
jgi:hypothetical protein